VNLLMLVLAVISLYLGVAASTVGAHRKARQTRLEGDKDGQEDG